MNNQKDELLETKDKEIEDLILEVNKYKSEARTYKLELEETIKLKESLDKAVILCNEKITELEGVILNGRVDDNREENI